MLDAAPDTPQRPALRRFAEWAIAEGLHAETITDGDLRRFGTWRSAVSHDLRIASMIGEARRLWNMMVVQTPGFPGKRLVASGPEARRTLVVVTDLPPVLQEELAAFAARIALPPDLARALDRYLAVHRPGLPGAESSWLFPSHSPGQHLGADGWGRTLGRLVQRRIGAEFTPHLGRHVAASMLFSADAKAGRAVQHVLGHADPRTSRKYGVLVNRGAQQQFGELVDAAVARRPSDRGPGAR